MSLDKRKMFLKVYTEFQFSYCSLSWMFHPKTFDNKINRLHENAFRILYSDFKAKFDELLQNDSSFNIPYKNT